MSDPATPPIDRPSVYLETTIPSLLAARPSRDVIGQANQFVTRDWWADERPHFDLYTSDFTLDECAGGDPTAAADRLDVLRGVPLLSITADVTTLSGALAAAISLPPRARTDAAHVAACAVNGVAYLLTWNCTHLANAMLTARIERTCAAAGFAAPRIVTPSQLNATSQPKAAP